MREKMKPARRPYRKPLAEEVRLVAEEAVLTNCKLGYGAGIHGPKGQCSPDTIHTCYSLGT